MPVYRAPDSDVKRLAFLKRALQTGTADRAASLSYLSQDNVDALAALVPLFETAFNALASKLSARAKEVGESEAAVTRLITHARDLMEVVSRRVYRKNQPASVLQFYGMDLDGSRPNPSNRGEWMVLAARIITGDAEAVAAGYEAAVCPSAAELQTALNAANTEMGEIAGADHAYAQAQEAVAALRPQADALIQEVIDELRYTLRKSDAPAQRRIMRLYGAEFKTLPGETPDPDEVGAGA